MAKDPLSGSARSDRSSDLNSAKAEGKADFRSFWDEYIGTSSASKATADNSATQRKSTETVSQPRTEIGDKAGGRTEQPTSTLMSALPAQTQADVVHTTQLHNYIDKFSSALIAYDPENRTLLDKLANERGIRDAKAEQIAFTKLPEFGDASKGLYDSLNQLLAKRIIPAVLGGLHELQLAPPTGLDLATKDASQHSPLKFEALLQAAQHGDTQLNINSDKLDDLSKLGAVMDWLKATQSICHQAAVERTYAALAEAVEIGIKDGRYDAGWRRQGDMNKESWSSAIQQSLNYYNRVSSVCESTDHLLHANGGFKSDALSSLPPGVSVEFDRESGRLSKVRFGNLMSGDLRLSSDENQPNFDKFDAWLSKYEPECLQAVSGFRSNSLTTAGFGQVPFPFGWVNGETGQFVSSEQNPGAGWKNFNLFNIDTKYETTLDSAGQVKSIAVTPDISLAEMPEVNYLNLLSTETFRPEQKAVHYKPNDLMVVQTGPSAEERELIQAKDLPQWLLVQKAKKAAGDSIMTAMDIGMVAEGVVGIAAKRAIGKLGVEEVVGFALKKQAPKEVAELSTLIARQQTRSSLFKLGIAGTAVLQGNGENETLDAIGELRHKYFLGMGVLPLLNNPLVRSSRELAAAALPESAARLARLSESMTGSKSVAEYARLAQTGALSKTVRFGAGVEKTVERWLGVAEWGFVAQSAVEMPGMLRGARLDGAGIDAAAQASQRANKLDATAIEKVLMFRSTTGRPLLDQLQTFKSSLGHLSDASSTSVDEIVAQTTKLAAPGRSDQERQQYARELMTNFCYSGAQIKQIWERNNGPTSEDSLAAAASSDRTFDAGAQKMAAVAILVLLRGPDNTLQKDVKREVQVPPYSVLNTTLESAFVEERPGVDRLQQSLATKELMTLLRNDLNSPASVGLKQQKESVLYDLGLVSGERYGSLLVENMRSANIESTAKATSIIELGRVISQLAVEEEVRKQVLSADQQYVARGLTAGLTSADLKTQLAAASTYLTEPDLKATANFVLRFLDKKEIDDVDRARFNEAVSGHRTKVSAEQERQQLLKDLSTVPSSGSEWERKAQAVEYLSKQIETVDEAGLREKIIVAYKECLMGPHPSFAVQGLLNFASAAHGNKADNASANASSLQSNLVTASIRALNNQLADDTEKPLTDRAAMAAERVKLIDALSRLPQAGKVVAFKASLADILDKTGEQEPFEEVRIQALKAFSMMADSKDVALLKICASAQGEPSAAVRMQAIDCLERLNLPSSERREVLNGLRSSETDVAIRLRLAKHLKLTGEITEAGSDRSEQTLADVLVDENRVSRTFNDVEKIVPKTLRRNDSIFSYFDARTEVVTTMQGPLAIAESWKMRHKESGSPWAWSGVNRSVAAAEELVRLETIAQERAFNSYSRQVSELAARALDKPASGGPDKKAKGSSEKTVGDAANESLLVLGNLVRGGSRMGEAFYRHRATYDITSADPGYVDFSADQWRLRKEMNPELCAEAGLFPNGNWSGKQQDVRVFTSDPWPEMELKVAHELVGLVPKLTTNLPGLTQQFLQGLGKESNARDETRTVLVDGLSRILSRPDLSEDSRREILRELTPLIGRDGTAAAEKPKSMIALLDLVERHAPTAFDRESDDLANLRIAIDSRRSSLSYQTPAEVRTRAHHVFARLFEGVLARFDNGSAGGGTALQRLDLLPTNLDALQTASSRSSLTLAADDAIERIVLATKGEKLLSSDPSTEKLRSLAAENINERVRIAAAVALLETGGDVKFGAHQLLSLALNTSSAPLRDDALRALKRHPNAINTSSNALEEMRARLLDCAMAAGVPQNGISEASDKELISRASAVINGGAGNSSKTPKIDQLQSALQRFGSGLLVLGSLEASKVDVNRDVAATYLQNGLAAYRLDDELAKTMSSVKRTAFREISVDPTVSRGIMRRQSVRGDLPFVIQSLNALAQVSASRIPSNIAENWCETLALSSLSTALTKEYLAPGSRERAESLECLARVHATIGSFGIRRKENRFEEAFSRSQELFDKARVEYDNAAAVHPGNSWLGTRRAELAAAQRAMQASQKELRARTAVRPLRVTSSR